MYQIKMSVKALAEFVYQQGDLISVFMSAERANIGSRIHRMLQKKGGADYQSEVFLKEETIIDDIQFIIDGRADGIIENDKGVIVDEIKSVTCDYEEIQADRNPAHWAQAYGYAYIYAKQNSLSAVTVQLTYYQIDIEQIKQFHELKTFEQLEEFYFDMLKSYVVWAKRTGDFHKLRDESIRKLSFPYHEYRNGQRELAVAVYKTILDEDILFAQAPTGIGKTVSTLFPAIKAIGEHKTERIFYLCAKNITASVARDCIIHMLKQGLHVKSCSIIAKDKMCLLEERNCDPKVCPYAKGYYNKIKDALADLLDHHEEMDKELFQQYGEKYEVCPFELSLDASLYCDIIICDYNYVFDPRVYLKRFFTEKNNCVFLIDEAHNMVERARSMYSAHLTSSLFKDMLKLIDKDAKKLRKTVRSIIKYVKEKEELCEAHPFYASKEAFDDLLGLLLRYQKEADRYLQQEHEQDEELKPMYFEVLAYLRIAEFYDDHYITWLRKENNDMTIKQFCMNPNRVITQMLHLGKAAVFFSATLTPIRYYTDLLLDQECRKKLALPSPFDSRKAKLIIHQGINTRYHMRNANILPICYAIYATAVAKQGNYLVYFPSYAYLKQVAQRFQELYPSIHTIVQESDMDQAAHQEFLNRFKQQNDTLVGFCVLGGMFAEGIDFKGEQLIGVIVVSVGLPQINEESDQLREYFDSVYDKGFAYAYQYPGMNKVLQATGRLIRDFEDSGVILLLDERYASQSYRPLFPAHMRHYDIINNEQQLTKQLDDFWKEQSS